MNNKKIAFVNNQVFIPWGGSEVLWYETALYLRKAGIDVFVYFPHWPQLPNEALNLEKAGCKVTYYRFIRTIKDKIILGLKPQYYHQKQHEERVQWLKKVKPDLLVLTDLAPRGRTWMRAAYEAKVRYVLTSQLADETLWHSAEELEDTAFYYEQAERIYLLSLENKIAVEKQLCKDLTNMEMICNPFNVNINQPYSYPGLINDHYHVACVARLGIEHKRQDILLEILADKKWKERNLFLNIFGRGVHESSLKNLAKYYNLTNVKFAGHTSDVGKIWAENHAFALPSRYEGVSLAMQEALISYRTCIVTKVGGVSKLIRDNETGFIAAASTTELYAEALERAWARRDEWANIGKKAGLEVRTLLPNNPVEDFSKKIMNIC